MTSLCTWHLAVPWLTCCVRQVTGGWFEMYRWRVGSQRFTTCATGKGEITQPYSLHLSEWLLLVIILLYYGVFNWPGDGFTVGRNPEKSATISKFLNDSSHTAGKGTAPAGFDLQTHRWETSGSVRRASELNNYVRECPWVLWVELGTYTTMKDCLRCVLCAVLWPDGPPLFNLVLLQEKKT